MGVCWLCGMSRRPGDVVIDLCRDIITEDHGVGSAQVCSSCVKHIARQVGMQESDVEPKLWAAKAEYENKVKDLAKIQAKLEAALKTVQAIAK